MRRTKAGGADWRVVRQVASWCLEYPTESLLERSELLRRALAEQRPSTPVRQLTDFLDHLDSRPLAELINDYVDLFDLSRRYTLYLSYWTDGDTRRRGETLAAFKQRYRDSGFLVDTGGELPDHLPLVLEYAAIADPTGGTELLQQYRASLELIRLALTERGTPYALVMEAVCGTLPGVSPQDRAAAMALAGTGPPTESVGIDILTHLTR